MWNLWLHTCHAKWLKLKLTRLHLHQFVLHVKDEIFLFIYYFSIILVWQEKTNSLKRIFIQLIWSHSSVIYLGDVLMNNQSIGPREKFSLCLYLPARGLVASLLFLSMPPLSVSFLLLSACSLPMSLSISPLLVLTVTISLLITMEVERTISIYNLLNVMFKCTSNNVSLARNAAFK